MQGRQRIWSGPLLAMAMPRWPLPAFKILTGWVFLLRLHAVLAPSHCPRCLPLAVDDRRWCFGWLPSLLSCCPRAFLLPSLPDSAWGFLASLGLDSRLALAWLGSLRLDLGFDWFSWCLGWLDGLLGCWMLGWLVGLLVSLWFDHPLVMLDPRGWSADPFGWILMRFTQLAMTRLVLIGWVHVTVAT